MRATPIPDSWTGRRAIVGPSDPTRSDMRACEYAVLPSREFPGNPMVLARIELDDLDRELIAAGAVVWLELDGGELPWQLHIRHPDTGVPE
jgi:hypothetical protein